MKIKDTKLGQWLKEKAPALLDKVGDLLPDSGGLGVVKRIISDEPELTAEQRIESMKIAQEMEAEQLRDVQSARSRELDYLRILNRADYFQYAIGAVAVLGTVGLLFYILTREIPAKNEHIVMLTIGEVLGWTAAIFNYHFGSSAGSRFKDMKGK